MNLSNISKHAKAARNADIKRRESIIKESPQPVESVLISQEPIITGEVHTEIPDEILMDMSELDAREAKEREENERKAAAETAPAPALPVEPAHLQQDLTEPVPEKELRLEFSRLIPYHDMMFAPLDKTAMKRLCDDITDNGMNESLLVVPADDGVYKIISGHNRKQAAVTLGTWTKLYCRVGSKSALTDEICHQVMAITNLFRVRDMTALELTKMIAVLDNCEEIDHRISYFTGLSEDELAELDRTVLQCINMSGLYRTIWEEIAQKAELSRSETLEALKQRTQFSPNTEMREQQLTEIFTAAQNSAWDTIRNCVNWLIAEVRSRNTIAELSTITLSMMTAA